MPKEWYDRHAVRKMDMSTAENRRLHDLYLRTLADKKPYFMMYIYPDLMRRYNRYIHNASKKCIRKFRITLAELLSKKRRTQEEELFVKHYLYRMPVGIGDCVMNKICRRIETAFTGFLRLKNSESEFDYRLLKYDEDYCLTQYNDIFDLYREYVKRTQEYMQFAERERLDDDELFSQRSLMMRDFKLGCDIACPNRKQLCNIVLDICYSHSHSKQFAWDICGNEIIENLLARNDYTIHYPTMDETGDIQFGGKTFKMCTKKIGGDSL